MRSVVPSADCMTRLIIKKRKPKPSKRSLIVTVSTKVAKNATERNRIKRRIRAIMAPIIKRTGTAYTIIAKPEAKAATFEELKTEIEEKLS